jgi:uncharacterized phage protein (TIGR01671 family)
MNIKFRFWDKKKKKFDQPWGFRSDIDVNTILQQCQDDFIIQQYTGLTDKNDQEIYEGDVLEKRYKDTYEIRDESGKFIKWSTDKKEYITNIEIIYHSGYIEDGGMGTSEYSFIFNGFAAKKDRIRSVGNYPEEENCGVCGVSIDDYEVVGNIFEGIINASG